jgi:hypothetical protein
MASFVTNAPAHPHPRNHPPVDNPHGQFHPRPMRRLILLHAFVQRTIHTASFALARHLPRNHPLADGSSWPASSSAHALAHPPPWNHPADDPHGQLHHERAGSPSSTESSTGRRIHMASFILGPCVGSPFSTESSSGGSIWPASSSLTRQHTLLYGIFQWRQHYPHGWLHHEHAGSPSSAESSGWDRTTCIASFVVHPPARPPQTASSPNRPFVPQYIDDHPWWRWWPGRTTSESSSVIGTVSSALIIFASL